MLYATFDCPRKNLVESYTSSVMMWQLFKYACSVIWITFHCRLIKFKNFLKSVAFYTRIIEMFYMVTYYFIIMSHSISLMCKSYIIITLQVNLLFASAAVFLRESVSLRWTKLRLAIWHTLCLRSGTFSRRIYQVCKRGSETRTRHERSISPPTADATRRTFAIGRCTGMVDTKDILKVIK